jgi:hypothetical protein
MNRSQDKVLLEVDYQFFVLLIFHRCLCSSPSQLRVKSGPAVPIVVFHEVYNSYVRMSMLSKLRTIYAIGLTLFLWWATLMPADVLYIWIATLATLNFYEFLLLFPFHFNFLQYNNNAFYLFSID